MWNFKNWLLAIAIAVLCFGLAACATDAPMEETGMEAEPAGGDEGAAESGDHQEGEQDEDPGGEEGEDGDEGESASEGGESE